MRVLRFEVLDEPVLRPVEVAPGVVTWPVPAREFALYRIRLDGGAPVAVPGTGPRIVLGTDGEVAVREDAVSDVAASGHGGGPVTVRTGAAAYAPADAGSLTVAGAGEVFVATIPE
jgi:mannose-6-phosphate isomerase